MLLLYPYLAALKITGAICLFIRNDCMNNNIYPSDNWPIIFLSLFLEFLENRIDFTEIFFFWDSNNTSYERSPERWWWLFEIRSIQTLRLAGICLLMYRRQTGPVARWSWWSKGDFCWKSLNIKKFLSDQNGFVFLKLSTRFDGAVCFIRFFFPLFCKLSQFIAVYLSLNCQLSIFHFLSAISRISYRFYGASMRDFAFTFLRFS